MLFDIGTFLRRGYSAGRSIFGARYLSGGEGQISVDQAMRNATFYSATMLLAKTCSKVRLSAKSNQTLSRRLQRPNRFQTGRVFVKDLVIDLICHGNALIEVQRGPTNSILALVPRDPEKCTITAKSNRLKYSFHETGEVFENIDGQHAQIIHVRDGGGSNIRSRSRLSGCSTALRALIAADALIADTFRNGPSMSYLVSNQTGGRKLDAEEEENLEKQMARFAGAGGDDADGPHRRGGWLYVNSLNVEPIKGATPADTDLRQLKGDLMLEVSAAVGVPPFRSGSSGTEKYSNASQANASLLRDETTSVMDNVIETFTAALGTEIVADTSDLVRGDLQSQADIAIKVRGGPVMTLEEARKVMGLGKPSREDIAEIDKLSAGVAPDRDRHGERADIPEDQQ